MLTSSFADIKPAWQADAACHAANDRRDFFGDGKDHVVVADVEDVRLAVFDPGGACQRLAPRTVTLPARVEPDARVAARIALFHMRAQGGGPAPLDRGHHTALGRRQRGPRLVTIHVAVATEHVRHLQRWAIHGRRRQKYWGVVGVEAGGTGRGSKSSGLDVEQTFVVAMRR